MLLSYNGGDQSVTTDKPVSLRFQIELEFGNVALWGEGKPDKNQQQTQPTYDAETGNQR